MSVIGRNATKISTWMETGLTWHDVFTTYDTRPIFWYIFNIGRSHDRSDINHVRNLTHYLFEKLHQGVSRLCLMVNHSRIATCRVGVFTAPIDQRHNKNVTRNLNRDLTVIDTSGRFRKIFRKKSDLIQCRRSFLVSDVGREQMLSGRC